MAYKPRRNRKRRMKGKRKVFRKKGVTMAHDRLIGAFPSRYYCKVGCYGQENFTFAGASTAYFYIKANSILTPDGTNNCSGAATLLGRFVAAGTDAAPYVNYIVFRSSIELDVITVATATGATAGNIICGMAPRGTASNYAAGFNNLAEMPYMTTALTVPSTVLDSKIVRLKKKVNIHNFLGMNKSNYMATLATAPLAGAASYVGNYNTDPNDLLQWIIGARLVTGASDATYAISVSYKISYDVLFFNRQIADISAPA